MDLKEYLFTLKVQELKKICKDSNICGISKMKKSALVEIMSECELVGIPSGLVLDPMATIAEDVACCHGSDDPLCDECEVTDLPEKSWNCPCDEICDECSEGSVILKLDKVPNKPDSLNVSSEKWLAMFSKGKKILEKKHL
tara:strand:+ start:492 stop:914 length:423 start_codon:yes stop_codon:yes gene_type:complete